MDARPNDALLEKVTTYVEHWDGTKKHGPRARKSAACEEQSTITCGGLRHPSTIIEQQLSHPRHRSHLTTACTQAHTLLRARLHQACGCQACAVTQAAHIAADVIVGPHNVQRPNRGVSCSPGAWHEIIHTSSVYVHAWPVRYVVNDDPLVERNLTLDRKYLEKQRESSQDVVRHASTAPRHIASRPRTGWHQVQVLR